MKFRDIQSALSWIMSRRSNGNHFERFQRVMAKLDNPQDDFGIIHVAGTNGKGSTVTYLRDMLMSLGYHVGTLQSPHFLTHLDRIRFDAKNIKEKAFLDILNEYYDFFEKESLSMFEMDYIIMCAYFKKMQADFVIVEVGMGGIYDSTNVVHHPLLSIITTIGHDHLKELGPTLKDVTINKCGIIKDACPVLVGKLPLVLKKVVKKEALRHRSPYYELSEYKDLGNGNFIYKEEKYHIASLASYQIHNAALALEALFVLKENYNIRLEKVLYKQALGKTLWAGRFEVLDRAPLLILDGAHNPEGAKALKKSLDRIPLKKILIFSALKRKDYEAVLKTLDGAFKKIYLSDFESRECFDAKEEASRLGYEYHKDYYELYESLKKEATCIVVSGSLYFISAFYERYQQRRIH